MSFLLKIYEIDKSMDSSFSHQIPAFKLQYVIDLYNAKSNVL